MGKTNQITQNKKLLNTNELGDLLMKKLLTMTAVGLLSTQLAFSGPFSKKVIDTIFSKKASSEMFRQSQKEFDVTYDLLQTAIWGIVPKGQASKKSLNRALQNLSVKSSLSKGLKAKVKRTQTLLAKSSLNESEKTELVENLMTISLRAGKKTVACSESCQIEGNKYSKVLKKLESTKVQSFDSEVPKSDANVQAYIQKRSSEFLEYNPANLGNFIAPSEMRNFALLLRLRETGTAAQKTMIEDMFNMFKKSDSDKKIDFFNDQDPHRLANIVVSLNEGLDDPATLEFLSAVFKEATKLKRADDALSTKDAFEKALKTKAKGEGKESLIKQFIDQECFFKKA